MSSLGVWGKMGGIVTSKIQIMWQACGSHCTYCISLLRSGLCNLIYEKNLSPLHWLRRTHPNFLSGAAAPAEADEAEQEDQEINQTSSCARSEKRKEIYFIYHQRRYRDNSTLLIPNKHLCKDSYIELRSWIRFKFKFGNIGRHAK